MALGEFELIGRYFDRRGAPADASIVLGIGDDCALIEPRQALAISTDMLVEGTHFFAGGDARDLGHKALAVNLSDLAAAGARPVAFMLALAMPRAEEAWLAQFSAGLFALADRHGCALIGGDTTRGPMTICITVFGEVEAAQALRRDGARDGDDCWVSGALGAAAWAVQRRRAAQPGATPHATGDAADARLDRPEPRVALGIGLRGLASAAIDVSDGLLADLGHIAHNSAVGIAVDADRVPVDAALSALPPEQRLRHALTGGDDYELAFCAPAAARDRIVALGERLGLPLTRIGHVNDRTGVELTGGPGGLMPSMRAGYEHFGD